MPRKSAFAAFAAAFALAVTVAASTALAQQPRPAQSVAALQVAAPALGMAILSAHIDHTSNPLVGAGVIGTSRIEDGLHFVAFNRSVEGCIHVASLISPRAGRYPGFIATMGERRTLDGASYFGVRVDTADHNGEVSDLPFHLLVFCAQ